MRLSLLNISNHLKIDVFSDQIEKGKTYNISLDKLRKDLHLTENKIRKYTPYVNAGSISSALFNKVIANKEKVASLQVKQGNIRGKIKELEKERDENIPKGIIKGLEVIALQHVLCKSEISVSVKSDISSKIAAIFEGAKSYQVMYDLRKTIEGSNNGTSVLHKLVYEDVDVPSCHRILIAINKNVQRAYQRNPNQIKFIHMVYSDIDDTIKGSLNDRASHVKGFYPSAMEFIKEFALKNKKNSNNEGLNQEPEVSLTFLSARPKSQSKRWNKTLSRKFPKGTKFYGLYGSSSSFMQGVQYYCLKFLASLGKRVPSKWLKKVIHDISMSKERNTFISFAIDKKQNIDRDLLLRPEVRPLMIGDCGEGDLIFLLVKMMGIPSPIKDDRIPEEYRGTGKWDGKEEEPGNPVNRPLSLAFAHAISSDTEYVVRPDPTNREAYLRDLQTYVFDNYVDNALYCLQQKKLDREAAERVVKVSKEWIKPELSKMEKIFKGLGIANILEITEEQLNRFPPDIKYRLKLIRSIVSFDLYISSL